MKNKKIVLLLTNVFQILCYALILMSISMIFKKNVYIDNSYFGLWCFIISIIIFALNKTVKPLLFRLTLPITGITLGLFYPFINIIILYFVSFILGSHFNITGNILIIFLIAVLISIMNLIMNEIIKWLLRR